MAAPTHVLLMLYLPVAVAAERWLGGLLVINCAMSHQSRATVAAVSVQVVLNLLNDHLGVASGRNADLCDKHSWQLKLFIEDPVHTVVQLIAIDQPDDEEEVRIAER